MKMNEIDWKKEEEKEEENKFTCSATSSDIPININLNNLVHSVGSPSLNAWTRNSFKETPIFI